MGLIKNIGKPGIRYHYRLAYEISLIAALIIGIAGFKYFPVIESKEMKFEAPQELFKVEDIAQTKQINEPPPPPEPKILIAAPSTEPLEDIELQSTELRVDEEVAPPPPPPKIKETQQTDPEPQYFVAVEEMPSVIGGVSSIQEKIIYPPIALRAGIEGKVYVLAFVDENGDVTKTKVVKGIGGGCDEAAEKAVQQSKFTPGKQRGRAVKVQVMVPVIFKLSKSPV